MQCEIGLVGEGMGGSSMSAPVSTSCAAALDRFPLVAGTGVHRDHHIMESLYSFLGLFAPVYAQNAQIRSAAHRVFPAALLLLEQYHNVILMLQKESRPSLSQIRSTKEDRPQIIS